MILFSVDLFMVCLLKNRLFMLGFIFFFLNSNGCCLMSFVSFLEFFLDVDVLRIMIVIKVMMMEMIEYIFIFFLWLKFIRKYIYLKK